MIGLIILVSGKLGSVYTVCTYPTTQYSTTTFPNGVVSTTTIPPPPCMANVPYEALSYVGLAIFVFGLIILVLSFILPKADRST
jgi:hypothetical protein